MSVGLTRFSLYTKTSKEENHRHFGVSEVVGNVYNKNHKLKNQTNQKNSIVAMLSKL